MKDLSLKFMKRKVNHDVAERSETLFAMFLHLAVSFPTHNEYRQNSNIKRTLICNKIVVNSHVVGATPVGAAPTTSSFST